ncbi:NACHT domain-containing protein [Clostridium sp. AM58-1XD]|uniref:protein kinase domain-containing protein n=1 Tax=Clostridium sp. AM58-1XD TaxID=2292307 RepID=UPI000E47F3ED|nr:NACHT domain-containing protein [Clostridium sp. AM58-1XD]RGZ01894.1 NACHT domain-containing protein [Clostridium sp. AM58-1XD]
MKRKRELLAPGHVLMLGGVAYVIEQAEGMGNSSIVYRAVYEDSLNKGSYHQVLIKELFPYHPRGLIYRGEDGGIVCEGESIELFETYRQSFYSGNEVNLELLDAEPDHVAGNINSYEAGGTYYSVMALHGGKTLAELMEDGRSFGTLRAAAVCIKRLLAAVGCFHRNGYLHLDISPDNILVMQERLILIDYNSVWPVERNGKEKLCWSFKDGYTAPEVEMREENRIGIPADIFSVCAVFFQLVTGRRLEDRDRMGSGLKRAFPKSLSILREAPPSASYKAVRIIAKGIYGIPEKRYQTAEEMIRDIDELIARIDGKGITHCALWESSRKAYLEAFHTISVREGEPENGEEVYLPRRAWAENGEIFSCKGMPQALLDGKSMLLKGQGGMGKTSFLKRMWGEGTAVYRPDSPAVCFIPLSGYQETTGEPFFIRKFLLKKLSFGSKETHFEDAMHSLEKVLEEPLKGGPSVILLLDGLNETGGRRKYLLSEIEALEEKKGVSVLITDRTDKVKRYGLSRFQTAELLHLSEEETEEYLLQREVPVPEDSSLLKLLGNPMMLSLYEKTVSLQTDGKEAEKEGLQRIQTMDDMLGEYLKALKMQELRTSSGNEEEQLRISYILDHLLPKIAGELIKRKKTVLSVEELTTALEKDYRNLRSKSFSIAFPCYLGKSRKMLADIRDQREWFDYAVEEQLIERMNLMQKTESGSYHLIHDNFMEYLNRNNRENRKIMNRYLRKSWVIRGTAAGAAVLAISFAAAHHVSEIRPFPYSEEEKGAVKDAMDMLSWNMGILDMQLSGQLDILNKARETDVIEGDERAYGQLSELIERKLNGTERMSRGSGDGENWIERLSSSRNTVPLDTLRGLYEKPKEMQEFFRQAVSHLEEGMNPDGIYSSIEKKEPLIQAYEDYIRNYGAVAYLEYLQVTKPLDREAKEDITAVMVQTQLFSSYMTDSSYGALSEDELKNRLNAAKNSLKNAEGEMRMQKFDMAVWP